MIDIKQTIEQHFLHESTNKKRYIFSNDNITFKDLKNIFKDVFGMNSIKFSKRVPKLHLYLTKSDGQTYVSSYLRPQNKYLIEDSCKLKEDENQPTALTHETLNDIDCALSKVNPDDLDKFFKNGSKRLNFTIIYPPVSYADLYGNKCFLQFHSLDTFENNDKVGEDKDIGFELFKMLKSNPNLTQEFIEITPEQLSYMKNCKCSLNVLNDILTNLTKLVDGLGWGVSIKDYVKDRYSRYIVNKAFQHDIDVSKTGCLVGELAARLSGTSVRPTKSDLATFAKREGIDVSSDNYKAFLDDVESEADQINAEIIYPIENIILYGLSNAIANTIAFMVLDPNPSTQKKLKSLVNCNCISNDGIDSCSFDRGKLDAIKKLLAKLIEYSKSAPSEIRIVSHGTPYSVVGDCKNIEQLSKIIL